MSQKYSATSEIEKSINIAVEVNQDKYMTRLGSLMNTAYYVAKSGLSFLKYTEICELQIKNGLDLGENYLTDVACTRLISSIADDTKSDLKLKRSKIRCSQCKILSCAIRWFYRCGNFRGRGCVSSLCKKTGSLILTLRVLRIRLKVMQLEFLKPLKTFLSRSNRQTIWRTMQLF